MKSPLETVQSLSKNMRIRLLRIAVSLVLFLVILVLPSSHSPTQAITTAMPRFWLLRLMLVFLTYAIASYDVVWRAVRNIFNGQFLDENFLMTIASLGAFYIGEYSEGLAVMIFYQIGEFFQDYAVDQSRRSIAELMDIRPDFANIKGEDGRVLQVDAFDVEVGAVMQIKAGERIPLDGRIISGHSMLDTSALTGESLPKEVGPEDEILSGCINLSGVLFAKVSKPFEESTVSKILDLVENASSKKSKSEQFITRFARVYTPIVVLLALLLAIVPPLLFSAAWHVWLYRALAFLVVSCPCALVISVPLSFFSGVGAASRRGILVKGSNYLETLAQTDTIVFDKTGTLTEGSFEVQKIVAAVGSSEELLDLAAHAESASNHPISLSLQRALARSLDLDRVTEVQERAGYGVLAKVDGRLVIVGNVKLMRERGIEMQEPEVTGTLVHLAQDGTYLGYILIADQLKKDAVAAVRSLRAENVKRIIMLTGDSEAAAASVAKHVDIDSYYAGLLPGEKVAKVEALLRPASERRKLAFVGDGMNDAPVLARADIGIAMGALGTDAAIEAADIVIMTDEPSKIVAAMQIARKTLRIANQNMYFAIGVKVLVLILSTLGYASLWAAVFADVGVTFLAVLNSFRAR